MNNKMKRLIENMPDIVRFAVFLITVCAAAGAEETDTWGAVTRINQIAGTWEGTAVFTVPSDDRQVMPDIPMAMTFTLRYMEDAEDVNMVVKLDFSQFLSDWSAFIGISADALWEIVSMGFKNEDLEDGYDIEIGAYFISFKHRGPVNAVFEDNKALFINADETKLKLNLNGFSPSGMGVFASPDDISGIILHQQ
jgi:hypothetical protein